MEGIDNFFGATTSMFPIFQDEIFALCPVLCLGKVSDGMSWDVKEMSINLLTSH